MYEEEATIWEGHPSHIKDLGFHSICALTFWLVLPVGMMLWRYLNTHFYRYEISSERIRLTTGVLSKKLEEMELYRVKDTSIDQPFFLRIFKLSNLIIKTSDPSAPSITIQAIPEAKILRENLRGSIEKMREKKGVREVDYR